MGTSLGGLVGLQGKPETFRNDPWVICEGEEAGQRLGEPRGFERGIKKITTTTKNSISQTIPGLGKRYVTENAYIHIEMLSFI